MVLVLVSVNIKNDDGLFVFLIKSYDIIILENVVVGIKFFVDDNGGFCFLIDGKFSMDFDCILEGIIKV